MNNMKIKNTTRKVYRLKRIWCFVLGAIALMVTISVFNSIRASRAQWYNECDQAYGQTTDYYTCRNYHMKGGK